jgi:multidrug efflux pump subunit AcrA (membrane-fusion protein)
MFLRSFIIIAWLCVALPQALPAREYSPLLTGEVFSRAAQDIFVPHTSRWRANISMMVPEGQEVQPGDVVVQFDGTDTQRELEVQLEQRRAQQAIADRKVALELATMKAEIPKGLIGALEYSENQLAKERGTKTLKDARKKLTEKQQSLQARQQQAELDEEKARLTETWWRELLERLSVEATQRGFVIHGNHPWTRAKFQEGDTVRTSFKVAEVADTADLAIRIWVNGVDRPHVQAGSAVTITMDALPDMTLAGRLESISDSATKRLEWSKAAYFEGTVSFDAGQDHNLLPGMSALVEFH